MATGDLSYCLVDLASLLGAKTLDALPSPEQAQVLALFNEAYRECYITPDGKRPKWATQPFSFLLKAPMAFSVTLAAGLKTLVGPSSALEAAYAGSMIKIGSKFYTYAGKDGANDYLVEPWDGASGDQQATFYYSSYVLSVSAIEVRDEPEILGVGRLRPFTGSEQAVRNRACAGTLYTSEAGCIWPPFGPNGGDYETGEPMFYFVDDGSLSPNDKFAIQKKFTVYPLPDAVARTVRLRANYVPPAMAVADGALFPKVPADAIGDILLPIARMKVVMTMRRYNGANKKDIIDAGLTALTKLASLASPQTGGRIKVTVPAEW